MKKQEAIQHHQDSIYHADDLKAQKKCGCFYCLKIFSPNEITDWTDDGKTALCPHCGIDAVIAETTERHINTAFLKEMHTYWF